VRNVKVTITRSTGFSRGSSLVFALALLIGAAANARAQTVAVYNSIPNHIPPNVASEGPEAYAFSELGDGLNLDGPAGRRLRQVSVVLSSWGCKTGNWYTPSSCVTPKGATFTQPITVNIYAVAPGLTAGSLLATTTRTFKLPYRPSSDSVHCVDGQTWYSSSDKTCYHGIAVPITVDFSSLNIALPGQIIVTVAFNSTHYGPSPVGESAACFATSAGCPYDSLNISTDSNGGSYTAIGSVLDPNSIFVNYTLPNTSCSGTALPGLALDAGCWAGYHPMIQVVAAKNDHEHDRDHGREHGNGHDGQNEFDR
jgi:hypothetical protein